MKRFVLMLALVMVMGATAKAQEDSGFSLSVNWGGWPLLEDVCFGGFGIGNFYPSHGIPSLGSLYKDSYSDKKSTGAIAVVGDLPVKRWLSVPLIMSTNLVWQNHTSIKTHSTHCDMDGTVQFMSGLRLKYLNRPKFNFYSALNIGVGMITDSMHTMSTINGVTTEKYRKTYDLFPAVQVVPFGVRIGGKIYGTAELGLGTQYFGGMVGIGVRL